MSPRGFSLVELLAVIAILGTLAGMLLPAVARSREASRRTTCASRVKQCSLGTLAYEDAVRTFPPGCDLRPLPGLPDGTQHAWSTFILPFVEEQALARRIDLRKLWNAPGGNDVAAAATVGVYVCPSGIVPSIGKADYAGISGSWIAMDGVPFFGAAGMSNGILVSVDAQTPVVRSRDVTDGLGATALIAEAVDRCEASEAQSADNLMGRWAWVNSFAQAVGFVNSRGGTIRSHHPGGAQISFADGRVAFFSDTADPAVLSAICTRNGGEAMASKAELQ